MRGSRSSRSRAVILPVAAVLLGAGCTGSHSHDAETDARARVQLLQHVAAPRGVGLTGVAWWRGRSELVVEYQKGFSPTRHQLYALDASAHRFDRLRLPEQNGCPFTSHSNAVALPSGELGYVQVCWGNAVNPRRACTIWGLSPRTRRSRRLVPYFLPYNAGYFTYAPGMTSGLINDGRGLDERLLALRPRRAILAPIDIHQVHHPAWSPGGDVLAVDGAMGGSNAHGVARADILKAIYLQRADGKPRVIMRNLTDVGGISWDATGRFLVVVATQDEGAAGLWLIDAVTGEVQLLVSDANLAGATWIPNTRLVAFTRVSLVDGHYESSVDLIRLSRHVK
jgi:hypothetical protein